MREDIIHYSVRQFLKNAGWQLIAGQYPDGSDDELPPLNIVDKALARDNSPDPRRHSMNKYVPDLVACKQRLVLLIEMKPTYSLSDEQKLETLISERYQDLLSALDDLIRQRRVKLTFPLGEISFVPCLGFGVSSSYKPNPDFCYFRVSDTLSVVFNGNANLPEI